MRFGAAQTQDLTIPQRIYVADAVKRASKAAFKSPMASGCLEKRSAPKIGPRLRAVMRRAQAWRFSSESGLPRMYRCSGCGRQRECPTAGIAPNTAPLNMNQSPTGGFFGNGIPNTSIDPVTGATINTFAPLNSTAGVANVKALNATTVRVGAQYKVSDQFTLSGDVEKGIHNETQHRYGVGASYQVAERTRLYTRY